MNFEAVATRGDLLLFLYADNCLNEAGLEEMAERIRKGQWVGLSGWSLTIRAGGIA